MRRRALACSRRAHRCLASRAPHPPRPALQADLPGCEVASRDSALKCVRCTAGWSLNRRTGACVQCTAPGAASCYPLSPAVTTACLPAHGWVVDPVTRAKSCALCDPANVGCAVCNGDVTKVRWGPDGGLRLCRWPDGGLCCARPAAHPPAACRLNQLPFPTPLPRALSPTAVPEVRQAERPRRHRVLRAGHHHRHLRGRAPGVKVAKECSPCAHERACGLRLARHPLSELGAALHPRYSRDDAPVHESSRAFSTHDPPSPFNQSDPRRV